MPSLLIRSVLALLLLAPVIASAAERPPLRLQGERDPEARGVDNLFISPAGQPFRAEAGQPSPVGVWFRAADRAGDGRLTPDGVREVADAGGAILDTDHDGVVDGFEIADYERKVVPEILPRIAGLRFGEGMDPQTMGERGRRGDRGGGEAGGGRRGRAMAGDRLPQGAGLFSMLSDPQPIAAADGDLSGKVTSEEWRAVTARRFSALDKGGLGYLTLETLPKTPIQPFAEPPPEGERRRRR